MMSSFSASFTPSARRLQQTEGTVHVGADAVLHPGHDPALPPDVEQRQQHQDDEDQHGLDRTTHQGSLPKAHRSSAPSTAASVRIESIESLALPSRSTAAARRGRGRRATPPAGVRPGTHTTSSAQVGDLDRQRDRAAVTGDGRRSRRAAAVRRRPRRRATGVRAVARQVRRRRPASAVVDQLLPGASTERRRVGWRRVAGPAWRPRPSDGAVAVPAAELLHLGARLGDGPEAQRVPELLGDAGQDPQVGQRGGVAEAPPRTDRGRPSQLTNVPALSLTGATGNTTSAARVTSVSRSSRADHEPARPRSRRGRRPGRPVVGVDAADDQAAELAGGQRGEDRVGVAAGGLGQARRRPRRWRRRRGRRRRRPDGRRAAGSAGSRSRAHRGHRRDAGPRRAGRRSCAARSAAARQRAGRRWPAARRPGSRRSLSSAELAVARRAPASAAASSPGGVGDQLAGHLAQAAGGVRRDRRRPGCPAAGRPCAAAGRSRRPRPRARSPASTTVGGGLEVGVRHRRWRSTTSAARNSASSAESGRARKSMSLVPSATRANLL